MGSKTVLPSEAFVKIDFRLAFDQKPEELFEKLKVHLQEQGFKDIEVVQLGRLEPSKTPVKAPIVRVVREAGERVYGKKPIIYPSSSGSGPDYVFTKHLGLDSVWTGCSPPFSNIHSPNEFITIHDIILGVKYAATCLIQGQTL